MVIGDVVEIAVAVAGDGEVFSGIVVGVDVAEVLGEEAQAVSGAASEIGGAGVRLSVFADDALEERGAGVAPCVEDAVFVGAGEFVPVGGVHLFPRGAW